MDVSGLKIEPFFLVPDKSIVEMDLEHCGIGFICNYVVFVVIINPVYCKFKILMKMYKAAHTYNGP